MYASLNVVVTGPEFINAKSKGWRYGWRPPSRHAPHQFHRETAVGRTHLGDQRQPRVVGEHAVPGYQSHGPSGALRARDVSELRVQIPKPVAFPNADSIRRIRHEPAWPGGRLDGRDRARRE